jgi:hypothetical protein
MTVIGVALKFRVVQSEVHMQTPTGARMSTKMEVCRSKNFHT